MAPAAEEFVQLRRTMVDCQLRTFDVTDHAVLERAAEAPREIFLPASMAAVAYSDKAVTIGDGGASRQLLPPMVLARMLQAAAIEAGDKVLMVGGGSGYGAAIVAGIAQSVIALECEPSFSEQAAACFARLDLQNVRAVTGPLGRGWTSAAPFDVIVVEGAIERSPGDLLLQLEPNGRLIAIERRPGETAGRAVRYDKSGAVAGKQAMFSCAARVLPGFAAEAAFSF